MRASAVPHGALTVGQALKQAQARIAQVSGSARLDAQLLLADVLNVSRARLLADDGRRLTADEQSRYAAWVERAAQAEPIPYILGRRAFYDRELIVTPDVLIPRPETELLLERALAWAKTHPVRTAADIGTGSGALAVTFAALVPDAAVYATDISAPALEVARRNAAQFGLLERLTLYQGDLAQPLIDQHIRLDLLMANLPYIPTDVITTLEANVREYEPRVALDGGADGAQLIRRLFTQIPQVCAPGALILLEIGMDQEAVVAGLAAALDGAQVRSFQDYAGLDRIVQIALA
ncbi:MAG: peptide chain release factor N(5)-glutamine methyltransferase [bacterium]|nr:peptide chain release factor N(5)-glutamine methyltransferase [bacterium]